MHGETVKFIGLKILTKIVRSLSISITIKRFSRPLYIIYKCMKICSSTAGMCIFYQAENVCKLEKLYSVSYNLNSVSEAVKFLANRTVGGKENSKLING